ncbi:two-pore potassium channel 1-like [Cynara cardunculus var. scolymus]|uniref:two-pore potassium channel 1-like n=1 Tax=Cynara cardunculus var. scolymus TaxID=59895 RepID=UPI000D625E3A|nr:two-pore potassium channel 1-like [Cynara cardunculus var. scolymus]
MTSVGYGDLSPNDTLALIFASIFSLLGLCVIGKVLSMILNVVDEQQIDNLRNLLSSKDQTVATMKKSILKGIKKKMVILAVLMVVGTPSLILIEELDFIHALYCISITITSAGYMLFTFTDIYVENRQRSKVLKRKMSATRPGAPPMMPIAPKRDDGDLMIPDGLIEEGMSTQEEDEAAIMEEFKRLDVNGTDRLTLREEGMHAIYGYFKVGCLTLEKARYQILFGLDGFSIGLCGCVLTR